MASGKATDEPKVKAFAFGTGGVQLVKGKLQLDDTEVSHAQNAEIVYDQARGGDGALSKRGGLRQISASALNSGAVIRGMAAYKLDAFDRLNYAGVGSGSQNDWVGTTFDSNRADSGVTISTVGAASEVIALADDLDSSYVRHAYQASVTGNIKSAETIVNFPAITDPGGTTGYVVKVRCRRSDSASPGGTNDLDLILTGNSANFTLTVDESNLPEGTTFQTVSFTLSSTQVGWLRTLLLGFTNGFDMYLATRMSDGSSFPATNFDIARVWIELPPVL